jgi:hypothetical protein
MVIKCVKRVLPQHVQNVTHSIARNVFRVHFYTMVYAHYAFQTATHVILSYFVENALMVFLKELMVNNAFHAIRIAQSV